MGQLKIALRRRLKIGRNVKFIYDRDVYPTLLDINELYAIHNKSLLKGERMNNYQITSKGEKYINNPPRNQDGRIRTNYFKDMILIYIVENGAYKPFEFKEYVQSLGILNDKDRELMPTRNYPIWKHHIDAAKQGLEQILVKNQDGTFSISDKKFDDAYNKISNIILKV